MKFRKSSQCGVTEIQTKMTQDIEFEQNTGNDTKSSKLNRNWLKLKQNNQNLTKTQAKMT